MKSTYIIENNLRITEVMILDESYLKRKVPTLRNHRLTDMAEYFDISTAGAHRALNDCHMNQEVFERLSRIER